MRKKIEPAPGRATGSGLDTTHKANSTVNSRTNQTVFFADRAPDRTVGGQPYWHVGEHSHMTLGRH